MVDASLNPTGQKSAAPVSRPPISAPGITAVPSAGRSSPGAESGAFSSADTAVVAVTSQTATTQQSSPIVSRVSGLSTYRDHESGRLVVQIFDQKRGGVLMEFPNENMLRAYPTSAPRPSIDHVVETKA